LFLLFLFCLSVLLGSITYGGRIDMHSKTGEHIVSRLSAKKELMKTDENERERKNNKPPSNP